MYADFFVGWVGFFFFNYITYTSGVARISEKGDRILSNIHT